ncbi:hypothetical protein NMY3_01303 [Candidatus Nitrosocosmicus oleophilus]|uniref:DUF488 domain-containing protein n=2 Tax=Candidatus Nitrosocosmicus oleophilus TaxID=1353260 RepID=A0A654LWW9_9ARCH|nr:hypothetical protein NMY3_01303 [Candidatus Nitrosocosmicus oleophilus]
MNLRYFTIGHSNRQWDEFMRLLEDNKIASIADVRRYPGSRVCPQFNKENMIRELLIKSIEYRHIEKLGGRRKQSDKTSVYDNSGWQNKSFKFYKDYVVTSSFKEGIKELLLLLANCDGFLAVMCSEAVPWRCHRRLIADYLIMIEGISVYNIIGNSKRFKPHKVTSFALRQSDDLVVFPN